MKTACKRARAQSVAAVLVRDGVAAYGATASIDPNLFWTT